MARRGGHRSAVMGFTEAELGFVLAALFIAVAGSALAKVRTEQEQSAKIVVPDTTALVNKLQLLRAENAQLRNENDELRALTSQMTPSCDERGETRESVARVTVTSANGYLLQNAAMPADSIFARLSFWIEKSRAKRCRFYIDVLPRPELSANDFIQASNRLSRHFYLRRVSASTGARR
jgi:hypothetical protein